MLGVNGCRERLRASRRSFQHKKILRWANIEKKFADSSSERCQGRRLFRNSIERTISFRSLDEFQFAKVSRKRRLRDVQSTPDELLPKRVLIRHRDVRQQIQDLSLPVSFMCAQAAF